MQQSRLVVLEIEVENNDRPSVALVFPQRLLDNRPHALEKVWLQSGLRSRRLGRVADDDVVDIPGKILLDRDREPKTQGAVETVGPTALIGIAIVSVGRRDGRRRKLV